MSVKESALYLHAVRYEWELFRRLLRADLSWVEKEAELLKPIERLTKELARSGSKEEEEKLKFHLGQYEAAQMICRRGGVLESAKAKVDPNRQLIEVLSASADERPQYFCDAFWIVQMASGEYRAFARGNMQHIESGLNVFASNEDPAYLMSDVFRFMMMYNVVGQSDPQFAKITETTLHGLIIKGLLPAFSSIPLLPSPERDRALKSLRKIVISAFDRAGRIEKHEVHRGTDTLEWGEKRNTKTVLPAWAVIQYAKLWLAEKRSLPTKCQLREKMEVEHPQFKACKLSYWAKVWRQSGLTGLPSSKPWSGSQKTCDFREQDFGTIVRQVQK